MDDKKQKEIQQENISRGKAGPRRAGRKTSYFDAILSVANAH